MPTFFIEDHAVVRYRQRVRNCSYQEAFNYIRDSVQTGAWMKKGAGGRQGGMQMRLADCVLVIKKDFRNRFDYAVATVLGPNETEDDPLDTDDEMSMLNAMADVSRRSSVDGLLAVGSVGNRFLIPVSLAEAKDRRAKLVSKLSDTKQPQEDITSELTQLNAWMKQENKRLAAEQRARAAADRAEKKRKSNG